MTSRDLLRIDPMHFIPLRGALRDLSQHQARALLAAIAHAESLGIEEKEELLNEIADIARHASGHLTQKPGLDSTARCAVDYALGRMTGAPSTTRAFLEEVWTKLANETQKAIHAQIREAIERQQAGQDVDQRDWEAVLSLPVNQE